MKLIIMLHGRPLAGKSTAAKNIREVLKEKGLKAEIVKSVHTRNKRFGSVFTKNFVDEQIKEIKSEKDESYSNLCDIARDLLGDGIIPILDATFHQRHRREWVYKLAEKTKSELIVVWVEYHDLNKIKLMLKERRENYDRGDNILSRFTQYKMMVKQTEDIKKDKKLREHNLKIIRFDRKKGDFHLYNCDKDNKIIRIIMNGLRRGAACSGEKNIKLKR